MGRKFVSHDQPCLYLLATTRAGSNNALHCTCVHVRTTYNEERFINVWNVSTQGGISLLNYVYIGYIIPLYQLINMVLYYFYY